MPSFRFLFVVICYLLLEFVQCMHPSHDAWQRISQFSDANTTKQLRLVSQANRKWIDDNFIQFAALINGLSNYNYTQTLQIHKLIQQNQILKLMLQSRPKLLMKLLYPQIKQNNIITNNLRLNGYNLSTSTSIIDHFHFHLTSIILNGTIQRIEKYVFHGRLFGLKLIDNEFKQQLESIPSEVILRLISKPRNSVHSRLLLFDAGVFEMIFNLKLYDESTVNVVESMHKLLAKYFEFKGVPQWLESMDVSHVNDYRRQHKWRWHQAALQQLELLWKGYPELFDAEHKDNLQALGVLMTFLRRTLGIGISENMAPFEGTVMFKSLELLGPNS